MPLLHTQAGPIWYNALCSRLEPKPNFSAAKKATIDAAAELYGKPEADAVRAAWDSVGVED
ncbi:MAG TPA: M4 family metallopeptidase [Polyangiales bacterium]|nr:M4 family metallopeptidase [Polyangiales bacterium]